MRPEIECKGESCIRPAPRLGDHKDRPYGGGRRQLKTAIDSARREAERRQLTVMFCDMVGSTALSTQLDPEDLRAVIQAYRETCAAVIRRFEGHLAKYIGDGLLVYFGYPLAHEDDAQRAVRAGLEIVEALQKRVPSPWPGGWLIPPARLLP